ncbi:hypothetical protein [Komagataeibacter xylinus]|uniref:hypothetical protein n=1 Tax=Komagataeibacter xylinus TaxID=28448 RepID=UPI0038D20209
MAVAEQPAMPVVVPAVAIMPVVSVIVARMGIMRMVVAIAGGSMRWRGGMVMGVVMAIRAMVVLAFAHGA